MQSLPLAAISIGFGLSAAPAWAHAFLDAASPGVGSIVPAAPAEVTIAFTEAVEPLFTTITVTSAAGVRVDTGALHGAGGARQVAIGLKPLTPGTYTVTWRATSVDTHKTDGAFRFTVRPPVGP